MIHIDIKKLRTHTPGAAECVERTGALDQALQGRDRAWQAQHRGCDRNSSGTRCFHVGHRRSG